MSIPHWFLLIAMNTCDIQKLVKHFPISGHPAEPRAIPDGNLHQVPVGGDISISFSWFFPHSVLSLFRALALPNNSLEIQILIGHLHGSVTITKGWEYRSETIIKPGIRKFLPSGTRKALDKSFESMRSVQVVQGTMDKNNGKGYAGEEAFPVKTPL